jgi:hypothetical protein
VSKSAAIEADGGVGLKHPAMKAAAVEASATMHHE